MKLWKFEGTADEFNAVSGVLIEGSPAHVDEISVVEPLGAADGGDTFPTVEQAIEVLSRRELSRNMEEALKALYEAGSVRLTSDSLKEVNGHDSNQFRGLMGAFGRRTKHTLPEGVRFLDFVWESSLGQYTWTLPETVREAMRQLKLV
jgi:hypothetical protein